MLYDTLKMARRLETDFTVDQARTLTEVIAESTADNVATKADLALLKGDIQLLKGDIQLFRGDLSLLKGELESAKVSLSADIVASESRLIKWIVGALAFNVFGTAGLVLTLLRLLH